MYSDGTSRPGTARTGMTGISQRTPWGQAPSLRQGLAGKRASIAGSVGGSSVGARPGSAMSRSHVPTLTSHAFFRPMSSQKLQAQRGLGRPGTMEQRRFSQYSNGGENRNSMISGPDTQAGAQLDGQAGDGDLRPPPSRGTEFTEQEGFSHITATTSPTHGHYPASSLADSVKPLQGRRDAGKNLVLDLDGSNSKTHKTPVNIPTPIRTPRSLRSSFILPRGDAGGGNREMEGGEKLESVASTPMPPGTPKERPESKKKPNLGRNYEYFEGSTVFCMGGRLQNTRYRPINVATGSFVVIPGILFFIFSAPWLWHNISPAIPITFAYLFFICFSSFVHASASDPGVSSSK